MCGLSSFFVLVILLTNRLLVLEAQAALREGLLVALEDTPPSMREEYIVDLLGLENGASRFDDLINLINAVEQNENPPRLPRSRLPLPQRCGRSTTQHRHLRTQLSPLAALSTRLRTANSSATRSIGRLPPRSTGRCHRCRRRRCWTGPAAI